MLGGMRFRIVIFLDLTLIIITNIFVYWSASINWIQTKTQECPDLNTFFLLTFFNIFLPPPLLLEVHSMFHKKWPQSVSLFWLFMKINKTKINYLRLLTVFSLVEFFFKNLNFQKFCFSHEPLGANLKYNWSLFTFLWDCVVILRDPPFQEKACPIHNGTIEPLIW